MPKSLDNGEEITHALVRYIADDTHQVTNISDIEEFIGARNEKPLSKNDYEQFTMYHCIRGNENKYCQIQILALGSNFEDCAKMIDDFNNITHAYVRFVKIDELKIIDIYLIKEFVNKPPETLLDFKKQTLYAGRLGGEKKYMAIEIMSIGHKTILQFDKENESKRMRKTKFNDSDLLQFNKTLSDYTDTGSSIDSDKESDIENDTDRKRKVLKKKRESSKNKTPLNEIYENSLEDLNVLEQQIINNASSKGNSKDGIHTSTATKRPKRNIQPISGEGSSKNVENDLNIDEGKKENKKKNLRAKRRLNFSTAKQNKKAANNSSRQFRNDTQNFYDTEWSDDSVGETKELDIFEKFVQDIDGEETQYIHLGWNVSIPFKSWKEIKKSKNESKFTKNLLRAIYGQNIVCRYLQKKPLMKKVNDKERSEITPIKMKVLYQCLKYWVRIYHENLLKDKTIEEICCKVRGYISDEISYQIRMQEKNNNQK